MFLGRLRNEARPPAESENRSRSDGVNGKTKMWVLGALVAVLAAGVTWQTIRGKYELSPKVAAVPSAKAPSAVGKPAAGVLNSQPPVTSAPAAPSASPPPNAGPPPSASPPPISKGSDEYAFSRPPGKPSGSGGDANSLRDNGQTGGGEPGATGSQVGGGGGVVGSAPVGSASDGQSMNDRGPSVEEMVQNAQTALARGNLISPRDASALYWARRARQVDPQNRVAIQIEDMILVGSIRVIEADRRAGRYDNALRNLDMLQSLYPNRRDDLGQLRSAIVNDQRRSAYAPR